jgi:peptidoglycan/xylan/chitin deacetylase (PgdA/CDA1 family)
MRKALVCVLAVSASLAAGGAAFAQTPQTTASATPGAKPAATCTNPNAIGLSRTVEIDTTGGPGFGFEHFKSHDFLRNKEVLLTFDDGPWPVNTPKVLAALADHCVKATFFPVGKHATWHPDILKQVAEAGHSVGSHTWSHVNLSKKGITVEQAKEEIEKGISAVAMSAGGLPVAPFFRFPALNHPPELVTYLGERNVGIFSTDMDSFDFTVRKPEQVIAKVMSKVKKFGKGIILMHDFQPHTADALPELLNQLKAEGYKVVHMKPRDPVKTLVQYDEALRKESKLPTLDQRPTASVVRTVD